MAVAQTHVTITPESQHRIDKLLAAVDHTEYDLLEAGPAVIAEATELLKVAVGEQFEKGLKHPERSTGATLKTLKSRAAGLSGEVEMAGGAPFKFTGTHDHFVAPRDKQALHWSDGGQDFFSKGHEVSGITADDFVGRALEQVDTEGMLAAVFGHAFLSVFERELDD